jgi:hypothetical protein
MARKRKDVFSKVSQVKKMSREAIGSVPSTKVVPQGKDRATKQTTKHPKRAIEKEIEGE